MSESPPEIVCLARTAVADWWWAPSLDECAFNGTSHINPKSSRHTKFVSHNYLYHKIISVRGRNPKFILAANSKNCPDSRNNGPERRSRPISFLVIFLVNCVKPGRIFHLFCEIIRIRCCRQIPVKWGLTIALWITTSEGMIHIDHR